jgi:hypothetical protein
MSTANTPERKGNEAAIFAVEHLKAFVNVVLDAFHSGSGLEGAPITIDIAKLLIWREAQKVFIGGLQSEPAGAHAWLRISSSKVENILECVRGLNVQTVRCLGPRKDGDLHVAYCCLWMPYGMDSVGRILDVAKENDCTIRDWEFYA